MQDKGEMISFLEDLSQEPVVAGEPPQASKVFDSRLSRLTQLIGPRRELDHSGLEESSGVGSC
jgi:hypothetical protein